MNKGENMNLKRNSLSAAIVLMFAAAALPAHAQSKKDFADMRAEIKKLREELNDLKKAKQEAPVAVAPAPVAPVAAAPSAAAVTAAAAANAELADRVEQVELRAKDAVVGGDIAGSFRLPGSETSVRLYGFAELNLTHELKGDNGSCDYSTCLVYAPLNGSPLTNRRNGTNLHARTSRIGIDASTPSSFGPISVKIEGDFNNDPRTGNAAVNGDVKNIYTQQVTNSYNFRLRQAYGQFGGLLIGQTWSTFQDVDNSPETVDFNGPIGSTFLRQPVIRYAYATKDQGTFTGALENSVTYVYDNSGSGSPTKSGFSRIPDLVARWDRSFDWGAISLRGVTHQLLLKDSDVNLSASARGYGLGASGLYKTVGDDFLTWAVTGGTGIGRYFNYVEGAVYDPGNNKILKEKVLGLLVGYQHKTSPTLRYNASIGIQRTYDNEYTAFALNPANKLGVTDLGNFALNRQVWQSHWGFIWNPVKNVDFGAEYIYGQRKTLTGERGATSRFDFSGKYYFN
jgi:hypothetical protein